MPSQSGVQRVAGLLCRPTSAKGCVGEAGRASLAWPALTPPQRPASEEYNFGMNFWIICNGLIWKWGGCKLLALGGQHGAGRRVSEVDPAQGAAVNGNVAAQGEMDGSGGGPHTLLPCHACCSRYPISSSAAAVRRQHAAHGDGTPSLLDQPLRWLRPFACLAGADCPPSCCVCWAALGGKWRWTKAAVTIPVPTSTPSCCAAPAEDLPCCPPRHPQPIRVGLALIVSLWHPYGASACCGSAPLQCSGGTRPPGTCSATADPPTSFGALCRPVVYPPFLFFLC